MGARLWYRSCPAVSQISNFTVVSSRHTDWARNAAGHKGGQVTTCSFETTTQPHTHTLHSLHLLWWSPGTHQIVPWRNAAPGWTCLQPCHPAAPTWTGRSWSVAACRWSGLHSLWSSYRPCRRRRVGWASSLCGVEHLHCLPSRVQPGLTGGVLSSLHSSLWLNEEVTGFILVQDYIMTDLMCTFLSFSSSAAI